jgi:hypothetical protein
LPTLDPAAAMVPKTVAWKSVAWKIIIEIVVMPAPADEEMRAGLQRPLNVIEDAGSRAARRYPHK